MPVMPLLNLAARPTFVRTFPRVGLAFGFFLILYAASLAALVWQFPRSLPWIAAVAGAGSIALWWRSRGAYGKNQRLPPGSLALLPLGPWIDHWHYAKLSRVYGPIFKTSHFFHPMVCLTNLESALRLLQEHDDVRLRSPKVAADRFLPCGFLRGMDPEAHKTYRRVVQALITPPVLATWEATISADISAALAKLAAFPGGVHAKPVWEQLILLELGKPWLLRRAVQFQLSLLNGATNAVGGTVRQHDAPNAGGRFAPVHHRRHRVVAKVCIVVLGTAARHA